MATTVDVACPKCGAAITLTEALTKPILEAERAKLSTEAVRRSELLDKREREIDDRRRTVAESEVALKKSQGDIDRVVEEQLASKTLDLTKDVEKSVSKSYEIKLRSVQEKLADSEAKRLVAEKASLKRVNSKRQLIKRGAIST